MDYGWIHVAIWFHLVQKQTPLTLIPLQLKWGTATKVTVSSKVGSWQSGVFHLVLEPLLDSFSNVELLKTVALIFHKMHLHWPATTLSLCIYYLLCSFPSCCQNSSGHKTFIGLLWHLVLGIWEWVFPRIRFIPEYFMNSWLHVNPQLFEVLLETLEHFW